MRHRTLAAALLLLTAAPVVAAQSQQPAQQQQPPPPVPKSSPAPASSPTPAPSPTPPAPPVVNADTKGNTEAKRKYEAMLEAAKKSEGAVDYKALRFAYFETPDYDPLVGMMNYRGLWGLVMQQNWAEAAKQAEAVLARNYVDINAHMVAHVAYRQQGDEERAALHRRWADGLLASVKSGGDGKSTDTAWHVISVSEEYAVIRSMNLRPAGQSLHQKDGHSYDVMKVIDPQTNTQSSIYFNVDKVFSAYGRK